MKDEYGSVTIRFFNNAEPEVEFKGRIEPRDISQRSIYFLRMGYATMYIPERQKWEREHPEEVMKLLNKDKIAGAAAKKTADEARAASIAADKALLVHALKLREYLDRQQVQTVSWIDTRDMVADALNKGTIEREAVREFFSVGKWLVNTP